MNTRAMAFLIALLHAILDTFDFLVTSMSPLHGGEQQDMERTRCKAQEEMQSQCVSYGSVHSACIPDKDCMWTSIPGTGQPNTEELKSSKGIEEFEELESPNRKHRSSPDIGLAEMVYRNFRGIPHGTFMIGKGLLNGFEQFDRLDLWRIGRLVGAAFKGIGQMLWKGVKLLGPALKGIAQLAWNSIKFSGKGLWAAGKLVPSVLKLVSKMAQIVGKLAWTLVSGCVKLACLVAKVVSKR